MRGYFHGAGLTTDSISDARISRIPFQQRDDAGEKRKDEHQMPGKRKLIADMAKTTAGDIDSTRLRGDACGDEDQQEAEEESQSTRIPTPKYQRQPAKNLQPGQVERERQIQNPGKNMIILNVAGKANRVPNFEHARINEDRADKDRQDAPGES